jgi:hypothetical protein
MWQDFYGAGGWGMHPVAIFGFFLLASTVLYALRPDPRRARLSLTLGFVTFAAGLLGTASGISTSFHYLPRVEAAKQLEIGALGVAESLHDIVFALMLVVLGGLIAALGSLRTAKTTA